MPLVRSSGTAGQDVPPDSELVRKARQGDASAFELLIKRYDRRLYRVARSVLRDSSEAEDVVQETFVQAFTHLSDLRSDASFSTWLTRIAVNLALRVRRRRHLHETVELTALNNLQERNEARVVPFPPADAESDPESAAARRQIREFLERAIDDLPEPFRAVFVMREVEEMSIEETAACLGLKPATVKTRLYRAQRRLRDILASQIAPLWTDIFPFDGQRCARTTSVVLNRLGVPAPPPSAGASV
jgi:RNA polymerase sigma-70 factor (ECF subfamily)